MTFNHFISLCLTSLLLGNTPSSADEDSAESYRLAIEQLRLSESASEAVGRLIAIDAGLADSEIENSSILRTAVLTVLAGHGTNEAIEHLRSVFETQTERRHDAAYALSIAALKRPTHDQDWRYLVRSLSIVEGNQAVSVLKALRRFRRRATKAVWVREVILIAMNLHDDDVPSATELLTFWTGHRPPNSLTPREKVKDFQRWFAKQYPEAPPAMLPVATVKSKWTLSQLLESTRPTSDANTKSGADAYLKATCNKCHRREGIKQQPTDDRLGPDLTTLGWRRQRKEILTAILFPSHHLNDEYPVTTVVLANGKTANGLLTPASDGMMKVVASDGKETVFHRDDLEETVPSRISNMPSGLLDSLSLPEIRQLIAFLTAKAGEYDPHRRDGSGD